MAADDPRDGHKDWTPRPDPTTLTTEQLRRELSGLREVLTARLDGMDRATELLSATVNRTPTVIQTEISHVRELMVEKMQSLDGQATERFASIALQFKERDERSAQLAKTQDEALKAALQSAEKLNAAQGEANKEANGKTEISVAQQLKAVTDKIEVINGRLDRGEGTGAGRDSTAAVTRANIGIAVAALAVLTSVVLGVILAVRG